MAKKLLQRRELREKKPARMSAAMGGLDPPPTGPGRWEVGAGTQQSQGQRGRERGGKGVYMLGSHLSRLSFLPGRQVWACDPQDSVNGEQGGRRLQKKGFSFFIFSPKG